jgi:hypothetical protein
MRKQPVTKYLLCFWGTNEFDVAKLAGSSVDIAAFVSGWRAAHSFQAGVHEVDAGLVLPTRCEAMKASTSFGKNRTERPILQ